MPHRFPRVRTLFGAPAARATAPARAPPPQFGRYFEEYALNPDAPSVERDDFALEIAQMDE
jgi:hypothetical protein